MSKGLHFVFTVPSLQEGLKHFVKVSCKSVNLPPNPLQLSKWRLLLTVVTRPDSAPRLAIVERVRLGFFEFTFGFIGFSSMFL